MSWPWFCSTDGFQEKQMKFSLGSAATLQNNLLVWSIFSAQVGISGKIVDGRTGGDRSRCGCCAYCVLRQIDISEGNVLDAVIVRAAPYAYLSVCFLQLSGSLRIFFAVV